MTILVEEPTEWKRSTSWNVDKRVGQEVLTRDMSIVRVVAFSPFADVVVASEIPFESSSRHSASATGLE